MEQCIKLSELNLQQLTEFVRELLAKLYSLRVSPTEYFRIFLTYIFWEQLADL